MKLQEIIAITGYSLEGVLFTSRENKYYTAGLNSDSGYVLIFQGELHIIVDGRYYTDMKQKNENNFHIHLLNNEHPLGQIINGILTKHAISCLAVEETMTLAAYKQLKGSIFADLKPMDFSALRRIKNECEITEIKKACNIAAKAYEQLLPWIQPGMTESEIANELVCYMKQAGAEKEAFDTIVLSGTRTALPHGKPGDRRVKEGDFLTIDFGARYHNYTSDITRTFQIGKKQPSKLWDIYRIVAEAQKTAIAEIMPGKRCKDIDKAARDLITGYGYGPYFTHNLGHSIGILCHENPRLSPVDNDILLPGMVFTVEPGIYMEGIGGVRIEDDILVTEYGCEVLTTMASKEELYEF